MSRVLVTGASGFVGGHVLPLLVAHGHEVHATARGNGRGGDVVWHAADLLRSGDAESLIEAVRPEALLHLAWHVAPGEFWWSTRNVEWVESTLRLARAFAASGGSRLVSAGTCAEYDLSRGFCTEFVTPTEPATPYGAAKHAVHSVLERSADQLGLSVAWGRIFFPYGPGEPESKLVASVIRALLRGEEAECTAGDQVRDYLHVTDLASALVHLIESDLRGPVNIGTGMPVTVAYVATTIGRLVGAIDLLKLGARPAAEDEWPLVVADVRRLNRDLGWKPSLALEDGLSQTVDWWRDRT